MKQGWSSSGCLQWP